MMDWIEKAYRERYGIGADVLLSAETNRFLASLRAAEPKFEPKTHTESHGPKPEEPKMFETYRLGETKFERCGNETRSLREGRFYVCAGGSLPFMAMADRVAPEDYYPLRIVGGDEEYDPNVLALARALHDLVEHAKGNRP